MSIKRIYKDVLVVREDDGFTIHLDERPVLTPGRTVLSVPQEATAHLILQEWAAQEETIDPKSMPVTRLAQGAVDRDATECNRFVETAVDYAGSDLLCYRAETPPELRGHQAEKWDPLLQWAADAVGFALDVTVGISAIDQPVASIENLRRFLQSLDRFELAGVHPTIPLLGSTVLALALFHNEVTAEEAHALSLVDELWQEAQWGQDEEAAERRAAICDEIVAIKKFQQSLRGQSA